MAAQLRSGNCWLNCQVRAPETRRRRSWASLNSAASAWPAAALALEDFRRLHGGHTLQAEVPAKLSLVYLELGRGTAAAAELERVANSTPDAVSYTHLDVYKRQAMNRR